MKNVKLLALIMVCASCLSQLAYAQDLPQKFFTDGTKTLEAREAVVRAAKGDTVYQCVQKELSERGTLVNKKVR